MLALIDLAIAAAVAGIQANELNLGASSWPPHACADLLAARQVHLFFFYLGRKEVAFILRHIGVYRFDLMHVIASTRLNGTELFLGGNQTIASCWHCREHFRRRSRL
ncbi:hypothetical protein V8C34DRAFT_16418 [Trichoderma compactum]